MQFKVRIDEGAAQGKYANFINIWHSSYEFVIDIGQVMPGRNEINVFERIVTNPLRAKLLLKALEMNVAKYEETFGNIDIDRHPMPEIDGGKLH
ncbi:MAG: DUF3467 domain-containing protein [Candidatus Coatesbacteria bacterium]|nr:DUF3467 domain-containing protein [Candidatus Coatesbacteria bacterium]